MEVFHHLRYEVGERVRPAIGGPEMEVQEVYSPIFYYQYRCVWVDPDGSSRSELFTAKELVAAVGGPTTAAGNPLRQ